MLHSNAARELYDQFAKDEPILDFHNHLPPDEISADRSFGNLFDVWLAGDHYKWRAMRANGVDERYCTGDASDFDKFSQWAQTVPACLRNPLYHWTGVYLMSGKELALSHQIGLPTPHERISIDKGICGAAAREKKTVIVEEVNADPRYIACSLKTRSEIVVPLMGSTGAVLGVIVGYGFEGACSHNQVRQKRGRLINRFFIERID